jgi:Tol biopolymer transport system component
LYPSFSPHGKQVAFSWDNDSKSGFHIYTAAVGGGDARRITNDAKSDSGPVWSPDGREIAFLRELSEQRAEVWVAQSDGSGTRRIKDIERANTDHALSWAKGLGWLVVTARPRAGGPAALFRLSTKTGEMRQITFSGGQFVGDLSPAVSPNGGSLAFTRGTSASWRDIFVVSLSDDGSPTGEPVRQTDLHRIIDTIAWTPDSRGLVFAAATTGSGARHLFQVDASAGTLNHDFAETGIEGDHPAISRAGTKLAYVRKNIEQSSIWRLELDGQTAEPRQSRMVSSTRRDYTADMSPDGKRLVFSSVRSGPSEIWISDTDGSNLKRITSLGASTPRWSPDGRRIAFESNTRGQPDIYVFTVETNAIERLTPEGASNLRPTWSRDGKYIYFGSNRTGRSQIWKVPSNGGDAIQITRQGGIYAIETFDGKSIYYTSGDQPAVIRTTASNGGEEVEVIANVPGFSTIAMAKDGLYYLSSLTATGAQLDFYSFAKHSSQRLATIDKPIHRFLSSPPDGRSVLYTQVDKRDSDLMLIDPFR